MHDFEMGAKLGVQFNHRHDWFPVIYVGHDPKGFHVVQDPRCNLCLVALWDGDLETGRIVLKSARGCVFFIPRRTPKGRVRVRDYDPFAVRHYHQAQGKPKDPKVGRRSPPKREER